MDKQYIESNGTSYNATTDKEVIRLLEHYRQTGKRVRVFFGDTKTGKDWLEEFSVIGRIGRSTGSIKIPLIIHSERCMAGPGLLDHCIVRIVDASTKRECYRHPSYSMPELTIQPGENGEYPVEVLADGKVHARFKSQAQAERWIAFMQGKRMAK